MDYGGVLTDMHLRRIEVHYDPQVEGKVETERGALKMLAVAMAEGMLHHASIDTPELFEHLEDHLLQQCYIFTGYKASKWRGGLPYKQSGVLTVDITQRIGHMYSTIQESAQDYSFHHSSFRVQTSDAAFACVLPMAGVIRVTSPHTKEHSQATDEYKEKARARQSTDDYKEKRRARQSTDDYKEKRRARNQKKRQKMQDSK